VMVTFEELVLIWSEAEEEALQLMVSKRGF
jgi:hypothetical protein